MGVLPRLKELANPVEEAVFIDGRGRRRARISYARFTRAVGGRLLDIMRPRCAGCGAEWSRGRVTFVGDACGAVSLMAGQGASLALGGAYVLGELLAGAEPIENALSGYQQL